MRFVFTEVDDAFVHCFQDTWHMRDWLMNDPSLDALVRGDVERHIKDSSMLKRTTDLANGSKHLALNRRTWTGHNATQAVSIEMAGDVAAGFTVKLLVESQRETHDGTEIDFPVGTHSAYASTSPPWRTS